MHHRRDLVRADHHRAHDHDGRRVEALGYVMRPEHWQYAGHLTPAEQAAIIAGARGGRGPNAEYLYNTVAHLAEMGIPDPALETLAAQVRAIEGGRCP